MNISERTTTNNSTPYKLDSSAFDEIDDGWDVEEDRIAAHGVALLRVYFASFGLQDGSTCEVAARSVVTAVLRGPHERNEGPLERRLIAMARRWVRDFSETSASPPGDWVSLSRVLLSKFPAAFLATPLPGPAAHI